ncbi:hypothetical protein OJAV_G00144560 [Oryzias javanicus]|uniref:Uncharacterized protein n=1 Tax=Oryzias javanicus TaxID=123683 RepID=A0A3S2LYU6_ORYJA|nr:hypothetical protein OJAV_G00144560 [Oryzias javanicus]
MSDSERSRANAAGYLQNKRQSLKKKPKLLPSFGNKPGQCPRLPQSTAWSEPALPAERGRRAKSKAAESESAAAELVQTFVVLGFNFHLDKSRGL